MISRRAFLRGLDVQAIERAIATVEARTSGQVRVSVAGLFVGDARRVAERAFQRLGMARTRHRNGVLIFVAPARRQVVVLGDAGIDARVSGTLWSEVAAHASARFAAHRFTEGLLEAIERAGAALAGAFPPDPDGNPNELPDAIAGVRP